MCASTLRTKELDEPSEINEEEDNRSGKRTWNRTLACTTLHNILIAMAQIHTIWACRMLQTPMVAGRKLLSKTYTNIHKPIICHQW